MRKKLTTLTVGLAALLVAVPAQATLDEGGGAAPAQAVAPLRRTDSTGPTPASAPASVPSRSRPGRRGSRPSPSGPGTKGRAACAAVTIRAGPWPTC